MARSFLNVVIVTVSTFGSRVLGLLREILLYSLLGVGPLTSAFILAFTLPNLFRRLLGEGALTSATTPVLAEAHEKDGNDAVLKLTDKILTRLVLALAVIILLGIVVLKLVPQLNGLDERWYMSAELGVYLFPYMLFVCVAAILGNVLNIFRRFAISSLSQIWLNLSMIGALCLPFFVSERPSGETIVLFLCAGVMLGGMLQVAIPAIALISKGWKPRIDFSKSAELSEVWGLFLPGILGAGILQVNIMISRFLAMAVDDQAVAVLYLANRLIELPLGVFAISIITVYFPELTRLIARRDYDLFSNHFHQGARVTLAIVIPASVGLFVLREPILNLLFLWGKYNASDVALTMPVLGIFTVSMPLYALATYLTRGFHAIKDTRTPVSASGINMILNAVLSIILMQPYGMIGLAMANFIAFLVHCCVLKILLYKRLPAIGKVNWHLPLTKIILSALLMGTLVTASDRIIRYFLHTPKIGAMVTVPISIAIGLITYAIALHFMKYEDYDQLKALAGRILRKAKR